MDAHVRTVRDILHSGDQFIVPFFQRHYEWEKPHWQRLLEDVITLTEEAAGTKHFLGPLVCSPFHPVPGGVPSYQLIDGQQRLATITIMLAAFRDAAKITGLDTLAEEIHEDYLTHRRQKGIHRFKVVPGLDDRPAYEAVIDSKASLTTESKGIIGAYSFFRRELKSLIVNGDEKAARDFLIAATARLSLVVITVGEENPYEIFESLNSTGLPLAEADLIRNFLFMQVSIDEQESFQAKHWKPFEDLFEASKDYEEVPPTFFYRSYLMREGTYCRNKAAYIEFKNQYDKFKKQYDDRQLKPIAIAQVEELQKFAKWELWLRRPLTCPDPGLRKACSEIQALDITTAHPLLLKLLNIYHERRIEHEDLLRCFKDIASFVIRRSVCGESTRGYGRIFPEAINEIDLETIPLHPQKDLSQYWMNKGWPDDAAFIPRLVEFPLYKRERNKCRLLLKFLEQKHGHKEEVKLDPLTIEHVMPQKLDEDTGDNPWRESLGSDWKSLHEKWVHTLGNLTLTGYNSELGIASFKKKQAAFANSKVSLNQYFQRVKEWDNGEIRKRGLQLAEIIAKHWPRTGIGPSYLPPGPTESEIFEPPEKSPGVNIKGKLTILIHWSLLKKALPDEEVCEKNSAATVVRFIEKLIRHFGKDMENRLMEVPVIRYPLSRNPMVDFLNSKTGKPHPHALIPGTDLYICTISDNDQKVKALKKLALTLSFPVGSLEISFK